MTTTTPLTRSTPSAEQVAASGIRAFVEALEADPGVDPHSVMALRHGRVIAEGWWAPYAADRVHLLYSISKSFTTTAVGFAIGEGLLSLDDTVLSHFPEYDAEVTDERSRRMRVRDVAAMASGHDVDVVDAARAIDPLDLVRGLLTIPVTAEPGELFTYNQPCTYALAAIVQRATGLTLTEYLTPRLFEPLGIDGTGWLRDGSGREIGYSGLHATTEAVAKLGQLYLDGGAWRGEQLLPAEWVTAATSKQVDNPHEDKIDWRQGYGFQFWMARHGFRGDGAYGQYCIVLPEQDVVVAVTSQTPGMQSVLDAAWEHLLPAVDAATAEAAEGTADAELAAFLASRTLPVLDAVPAPDGVDDTAFTAEAGSDQPSLTGVEVNRSGGGWTLVLVDDSDRLEVPLGIGEWGVAGPLAASGGWDASGGFTADVAFIETAHRLHLVGDPASGTFTARWETTPLHAATLGSLRKPIYA